MLTAKKLQTILHTLIANYEEYPYENEEQFAQDLFYSIEGYLTQSDPHECESKNR